MSQFKNYLFARPAPQHHLQYHATKLTQLQLIDDTTRAELVLNLFSPNTIQCRLSRDLRWFTKQHKCTPELFITMDYHVSGERHPTDYMYADAAILAAIVRKSHPLERLDRDGKGVWAGGTIHDILARNDRTYEILVDREPIARWTVRSIEVWVSTITNGRSFTKSVVGSYHIGIERMQDLSTSRTVGQEVFSRQRGTFFGRCRNREFGASKLPQQRIVRSASSDPGHWQLGCPQSRCFRL